MRIRILGLPILVAAGFITLSLLRGQDRSTPPHAAGASAPAPAPAPAPREAAKPAPPPRDFSKLTPLQRQMLFSTQRGADWLFRMNGAKGRFVYGYLPALKAEMEG